VKFAAKPQLAQRMIERAITAKAPFTWVAADELHGGSRPPRAWLEQRRLPYVLAAARDHRVPAGAGHAIRADQLAARLPRRAWQRLPAGDGAKGRRRHDRAWVANTAPRPRPPRPIVRR
jgi:SRSO17 transposase